MIDNDFDTDGDGYWTISDRSDPDSRPSDRPPRVYLDNDGTYLIDYPPSRDWD